MHIIKGVTEPEIDAASIPQKRAEEFCRMIQEGSNFSTTAANDLIAENYGLVRFVANRALLIMGKGELEDLCQEASIAMLLAAKKYQPEKGKFSTYAFLWMYSGASRAAMKSADEQTLSLDASYDDGSETKDSLFGCLSSNQSVEEEIMRKEEYEELYEAMKYLKPESRALICMRYGIGGSEPMKLREIAERFGISPEAVRQRINRVLSGLKKQIESTRMGIA